MSEFSASLMASSTSIPRQRTVHSNLEWRSNSCTALRLPDRWQVITTLVLRGECAPHLLGSSQMFAPHFCARRAYCRIVRSPRRVPDTWPV